MTIEVSRRLFLPFAAASAVLPLIGIRASANAADATVIDVISDGDTNITDWFTNTLAPLFQQANPSYTINVVLTRAEGGNNVVGQRVVAAFKVKANPKVDYFEEFDPRRVPGAPESGAFETITAAEIPNLKLVNPAAIETPYVIPYRGSQVLLAYNSDKVAEADVPKTFADLVAWIKKNPGQFVYCRPDKGGSGKNFVIRAIHEVNGKDPSLFTPNNYTADLAKQRFAPAWTLLKELGTSLYDNGSYPADNNPVLQLFAGGAVSMITAWSDEALQGLAQGALPPSTKLTQLSDLPFAGGYTFSSIPTEAAHKDGAFKFANFLLQPEIQAKMVADFGAFPSVDWKYLPTDLAAKYKGVASTVMPTFPGGPWSDALNNGWYTSVAPGISRN